MARLPYLDETDLPWETAWDITTRTCAYTNHTLLPEALEKWPVELMERVLPRHMQIIYAINARVLQKVEARFPGDGQKLRALSMIEEGDHRQVRMTSLAVAGSHSVNGVSALHSELLQKRLLPESVAMWPERFNNKTNGITHRRWLLQCNPELAALITEQIGDAWTKNLDELRRLEPKADDPEFRQRFRAIKRNNKVRLAALIKRLCQGEVVDPDSMFDVQVKRLHEYKRQLLNALHVITLFHRLKANPKLDLTPRTFVFGAKAAPSYHIAKRIIKLINSVGRLVNSDPDVAGRLKVVYLPDYRVSLAEVIIPAANLSEQISTAGMEASGTGNMKLSLNGALTVGTWDGANIEIAQAVGLENIFIFGHRAEDLLRLRQSGGYRPQDVIAQDPELRAVIDAIRRNEFMPSEPDLFVDIYRLLVEHGDTYFHLADYRDYVGTQEKVSACYRNPDEWDRRAILNVARMGPFSSDRTIRQYAEEIWNIEPVPVVIPKENGNGAATHG